MDRPFRRAGAAVAVAFLLLAAGSAAAFGGFEPSAAPRPAPDTPFLAADDTAASLARFKGRLVLLNLWATWCAPCRAELPALDAVQAALGGDRFAVVAVSVDTGDGSAVRHFFDERGITGLEAFRDPAGRLPRALGVTGYPVSFLIDPAGRIAGRFRGPVDWRAAGPRAFLADAIQAAFRP